SYSMKKIMLLAAVSMMFSGFAFGNMKRLNMYKESLDKDAAAKVNCKTCHVGAPKDKKFVDKVQAMVDGLAKQEGKIDDKEFKGKKACVDCHTKK
ncbi:hypothetical protein WDW37_20675, partial [Bdellovibrionota bacterium FG-1]